MRRVTAGVAAALTVLLAGGCGIGGGGDEGKGSAAGGRAGATAGPGLTTRPFSPTSPWNTEITVQSVDPNSPTRLALAAGERPTGLYINTRSWTVPVVSAGVGTRVQLVCRRTSCGPDSRGLTALTLPADAQPRPQWDGWLTAVDVPRRIAYDFWRARRVGNVMSYAFVRRWNLNGEGAIVPTRGDGTDADAVRGAGTPLLAGLIDPRELRAGRIDHALAIALPDPAARLYVPPAAGTDGDATTASVPEGARLRLRADVALPLVRNGANRRSAQVIAATLRRYGAIVVDRARVPTLYGRLNADWTGLLRGDELAGLTLSDFEVLQMPARSLDPPLPEQEDVR